MKRRANAGKQIIENVTGTKKASHRKQRISQNSTKLSEKGIIVLLIIVFIYVSVIICLYGQLDDGKSIDLFTHLTKQRSNQTTKQPNNQTKQTTKQPKKVNKLNQILIYLNQNRTDDTKLRIKHNNLRGGGHGVVNILNNSNEEYVLKQFYVSNTEECIYEANILRILDGIKQVPTMYNDMCATFNAFQMELFYGKSLGHNDTHYTYGEAWRSLYPVMEMMAERDLYHNDLHEGNILKTADNEFRLIDFSWIIMYKGNHNLTVGCSKTWRAPNRYILCKLTGESNKENVGKIKAKEKILKKLLLEMTAYELQFKLVYHRSSDKEQRKWWHLPNKIHWQRTAEVARNMTEYQHDDPKHDFLYNQMENLEVFLNE